MSRAKGRGGKGAAKKRPAKAKKPAPYTPLDDAALKQLALDYIAGHVTTDQQVQPTLLHMIFMPLAMMDVGELAGARLIYGNVRTHATVPGRSLNGSPIFLECGWLDAGDLKRLCRWIEKLRVAIEGVGA